MRTRHVSYPSPSDGMTFFIRPKAPPPKRRKTSCSSSSSSCSSSSSPPPPHSSSSPSSPSSSAFCLFDSLHDDILVSIMASLSSSAASPADLINAMLTCKRFCAAGTHPLVLSKASLSVLAVSANKWSDGSHRFLKQCSFSGNAEASYTLGMIRFYCFNERERGASLMAQAAIAPHASALHSLAIIQFNGSGGTRKDKNLKNGASLCAKAAALGHVDAMRELGHCLQDGYGVSKNVTEGRRLLLEANAREAAAAVSSSPRAFVETALQFASQSARGGRCYLHHHHNSNSNNNHYRTILLGKLEVSAAMASRASLTTAARGAVRSDVSRPHFSAHALAPSPLSSSPSESVEALSTSTSNAEAVSLLRSNVKSSSSDTFSAFRSNEANSGSIHVDTSSVPSYGESPSATIPSETSVPKCAEASQPTLRAEVSNSNATAAENVDQNEVQQVSSPGAFHNNHHHHHHHQNHQFQPQGNHRHNVLHDNQNHQHHPEGGHHHLLHPVYRLLQGSGYSLLSDFGCNVPPSKLHVANKFLVEWFSSHPPSGGLRLCSHANCGRPETRRHEFRRCSACGKVNYCSRACQALDWKVRHKLECNPVADWEERADNGDAVNHHHHREEGNDVQNT